MPVAFVFDSSKTKDASHKLGRAVALANSPPVKTKGRWYYFLNKVKPMKVAEAKLSGESQLVLPKLLRERLRLKMGDSVWFVDSPAVIVIERVPAS